MTMTKFNFLPLISGVSNRSEFNGREVFAWARQNENAGVIEAFYTINQGYGVEVSHNKDLSEFVEVDEELYTELEKLHETLTDSPEFYSLRDFAKCEEVEFQGETYDVHEYLDDSRPENQILVVSGIAINPRMRIGFSNCPHELRPSQEIEDWWEKPFIKAYKERFSVYFLCNAAWDRPTLLGNTDSLLDAIEIAKEYQNQE